MLVTRAVVSANRCGFCHLALLKLFTSLAGVPPDLQSLIPATLHGRKATSRVKQPRALLSTSLLRTSNNLSVGNNEDIADDRAQHSVAEADIKYSSTTTAAHVPWYLQVDTPQPSLYPISDRQRLPDMPSDAPPVLEPLLKYVSVDLGLDDLTLFDLRKLDPPPALGSKLLMLLGTARSERHLHVSADRLCRWLRSTYRLTPFADGLLGRNELKLKMRRKARRAKLLGTVGTSASSTADDGVRTGWVCVNVGTVESGKASQEDPVATAEIVGFGLRSTGVNIVIQMFTEEKRGELDLEELWGGVLKEQVQSPIGSIDHAPDVPDIPVLRLDTPVELPMNSDRSHITASSHPRPSLWGQTQVRAFHSGRKLASHDGNDENLDQSSEQDSITAGTTSEFVVDEERPSRTAALSSSEADQNLIKDELDNLPDQPHMISPPDHIRYLKSLPNSAALEALGQGINDISSTSFLRAFYTSLSERRDVTQMRYRLELLSYGMKLGHEGYPKSTVGQMLQAIRDSSPTSPRGILIEMLEIVVLMDERGTTTGPMSLADLTTCVEILEELNQRGYTQLPKKLVLGLRKESHNWMHLRGPAEGKSAEVDGIRDSRSPRTVQELSHILATFTAKKVSEAKSVRMLRYFAKKGKWHQFWQFWRNRPEHVPRSEDMYAEMFRALARGKLQHQCAQVLETWVPAMDKEETPVRLEGKVAKAVKDCLLVAHPTVEEDARAGSGATDRWVSLWVQCQTALEDLSETRLGA